MSLNRKNPILVFDLDNTLLLRNKAMLDCIENVFEIKLSLSQKLVIQEQDEQGHSDRLAFCKWLKSMLNIPLATSTIWAAIKNNIGYFVQLNKDAKMVLEQLQSQYELVLLTNGGIENQQRKITQTGLNAFFSAERIFISEYLGYKKPDQRVFQVIQNQFKPNTTFYMIGDHWEKDILGAIEVGWRGIHLTNKVKRNPIKNVRIITSLVELNQILDECNN